MLITTEYRTDPSGRVKVTAKGGGRQRTIYYDSEASVDRNHGLAAGTLLRALYGQVGEPALSDLMKNIKHENLGFIHTFEF